MDASQRAHTHSVLINAEQRRKQRQALKRVLALADLPELERKTFPEFQSWLDGGPTRKLSRKQARWVYYFDPDSKLCHFVKCNNVALVYYKGRQYCRVHKDAWTGHQAVIEKYFGFDERSDDIQEKTRQKDQAVKKRGIPVNSGSFQQVRRG